MAGSLTDMAVAGIEGSGREWRLAAGVRLRPEPFGGLAFASRTGKLVVLAPAAYALLVNLGREFPPAPITEQARAVLHRLARRGIVVESPA